MSDDPVEAIVRLGLTKAGIAFVEEEDPRALRLDFYLPVSDVHIEVKRFYAERIAEQMSRAPNVIAIQGMKAAVFFAAVLARPAPGDAQ